MDKWEWAESFEIWGTFSATTDFAISVHGLLSYSPETGMKLELAKPPSGDARFGFGLVGETFPTIFGQLYGGKKVTLFDCFVRNSKVSFGFSDVSPTIIVVNTIIVGDFISSLEDCMSTSVTIGLSSLGGWLCRQSYSNPTNEMKDEVIFNIKYLPAIETNIIKDGLSVRLRTLTNIDFKPSSMTISDRGAVEIRSEVPSRLSRLEEVAHSVRSLIELLGGEVQAITSAKYVNCKSDADRDCYLIRNQRASDYNRSVHPAQFFFNYRQVSESWDQMLRLWLNMSHQRRNAISLYSACDSAYSLNAIDAFVLIVQAMESYHRSCDDCKYIDDLQYEEIKATLIAAISSSVPQDLRASLEAKIQYGNEVSLRTRLRRMCKRLSPETAKRIVGDVGRSIGLVVDTRNHLTHNDVSGEKALLDGIQFFHMAVRLRILLATLLLLDLGVSEDVIYKRLNEDWRHCQMLAQPLPYGAIS